MDHATCFRLLSATHFATSLLPLTVRYPGAHRDRPPDRRLPQGRVDSPSLPPVRDSVARPASRTGADHRRMDVQPHRAGRPSGHAQSDVFPGSLVPPPFQNPQFKVATLFGTITLWRDFYQPLHGVEPSIFPLEIRSGLEVGLATPALTEASAKRRSRPARIAS